MATVPVGVAGGQATGAKNAGLPVLGGQSGRNQFSPVVTSGTKATTQTGPANGTQPIVTNPVASSASITGQAPSATQATAAPINTQPTQANTSGNPLAGYTPEQDQQLQKQLNDTYGKGEGQLLYSLLNNLGGSDSSYMQAYQQAMGNTQAEGLATIDTSLGNAGISANSSAAAIEKGDYLSSLGAQEGLQEQQLLQTQQQETIGLVQGMQGQTSAENSSSWLNTLAQVGQAAAPFVGMATGGIMSATATPTVPTLNTAGADPLGLANQGAIASQGIQSPLSSSSYGSVPIF